MVIFELLHVAWAALAPLGVALIGLAWRASSAKKRKWFLLGGTCACVISLPALYALRFVWPPDFLPIAQVVLPAVGIVQFETSMDEYRIAVRQTPTDDFYWTRIFVERDDRQVASVTLDADDDKIWRVRETRQDGALELRLHAGEAPLIVDSNGLTLPSGRLVQYDDLDFANSN